MNNIRERGENPVDFGGPRDPRVSNSETEMREKMGWIDASTASASCLRETEFLALKKPDL